jgi:ABC-2 type transport system permease protein
MNTLIITRRELTAFFVSTIAYIVGAAFLFITGLFFFFTVSLSGVATLSQVFSVISTVLLFIAPVLTMRLLAEEARLGTLELLLTAPVRDWEVVLGKFLAAFIFFLVMLLPTLYYLFVLTRFGSPDLPVTLSGYLGIILLGAMLLSIGILTSALSTNQIIAAVMGVALSIECDTIVPNRTVFIAASGKVLICKFWNPRSRDGLEIGNTRGPSE